jgi:hypothetical protein
MILRAGLHQAKKEVPFLLLVSILGGAFMIGQPAIERVYDKYLRDRPFITASIDVRKSPSSAKPTIWYRAHTDVQSEGTWTAYILVDDRRSCGSKGQGNYGPGPSFLKPWAWADWLGKDCAVPNEPFKACVFYQATILETGVSDTSPVYCSEVYTP